MIVEELNEMINFAVKSIEQKTDKTIEVKVLLTLHSGKNKSTVMLNVNEIGFDDKTATVYIKV